MFAAKQMMKFFVHGLLFSLLFTLLAFAGIFALLVLVTLGSFIGLILGLGILIVFLAVSNNVIVMFVWDFEMKWSFLSLLGHGTVLFIALLVIHVPMALLLSTIFPGTATVVVIFIIGCFIDGAVGKAVAQWWVSDGYEDTATDSSEQETLPFQFCHKFRNELSH